MSSIKINYSGECSLDMGSFKYFSNYFLNKKVYFLMSAINDVRLTLDHHHHQQQQQQQQQQKVHLYHSHSNTGLVPASIELWLIIVLHTYVTEEGIHLINTVWLSALSDLGEVYF
jgi:hypothetical protein